MLTFRLTGKRTLAGIVALLSLVALDLTPSHAVTFAAYGNYIRQWGIVRSVYDTTDTEGIRYIAFETEGADGTYFYWDCGSSWEALACDEVSLTESILVNGHARDDLALCFRDPIVNTGVPNGIYQCMGTVPSEMTGPCTLLTP